MVDAKAETCLNGGSEEGVMISGARQFKTLSGYEAADERNSWDSFKQLIADEELRYDASTNMKVADEASASVTLMVSVEDTGIGIPIILPRTGFSCHLCRLIVRPPEIMVGLV